MSASRHAHGMARDGALVPRRVKEAARAALSPFVRLALALRLTANTITVFGLVITTVAAVLVAQGLLLAGAGVLVVGSLLDAVDGALARAAGGGTKFGAFLDSTLDRASEAILFTGVAGYFLLTAADPALPVLLTFVALGGSFIVSYSRARAEGAGFSASVGLAQRTERLVLVIAGIALAGLGLEIALLGAIAIIAALAVATVIQRIWHVWRLAEGQPAAAETEIREERTERG